MTCECCGAQGIELSVGLVFGCTCADELFCRKCNRCEKHCKCTAAMQVLDVPMTEQLLVAKYEARRAGVRI